MADLKIIREFLISNEDVTGLCLMPDLSDPEAEKKNLIDLYRMWAIIPEQTHSCNVAVAERYRRFFPNTDALITFETDVPVGVKTADCVPILIYASDVHCVGAIHAGWKGTIGGIVDNVMDILADKGADPASLKVVFGPSISKDKYEVDADLVDRFIAEGFGEYVYSPEGIAEKPHIDLQGVNMERFLRRGVKLENISLHKGCSYSSKMEDGTPMYASHRRSKGEPARMLTCIMLLSESEKKRYGRYFNANCDS